MLATLATLAVLASAASCGSSLDFTKTTKPIYMKLLMRILDFFFSFFMQQFIVL